MILLGLWRLASNHAKIETAVVITPTTRVIIASREREAMKGAKRYRLESSRARRRRSLWE